MPFCCIAIVAIAIIYFIGLWIRQLFSWPRRDVRASELPAPPRALSGSVPVYGHTRLFSQLAGDIAHTFAPTTKEMRWYPGARQLGDCFAIFIWGQWRIVVKGPERTKIVLSSMKLKEGWPWSPPVNLLGRSCLCFLEDSDLMQLKRMIQKPLAQKQVLSYAKIFAKHADVCLDNIQTNNYANAGPADEETCVCTDNALCLKIKWEAMRSYTFDLVNGPVLATNITENQEKEKMLRWMERMKAGVDTIKTTFGPEWMYIWIFNEYGRALNARMHLEEIIQKHVQVMNEKVPVKHEKGHLFHEPSTQVIPLKALRDNLLRNQEGVFGAAEIGKPPVVNRKRTNTMPNVMLDSDEEADAFPEPVYVRTFHTEQDLARPKYESSPALATRKKVMSPSIGSPKAYMQNLDILQTPGKSQPVSILENILRQEDVSGHGLSQVVTMDIALILWLAMEVGNAWTFMALNLLSTDKDACLLVLDELDELTTLHRDDLMNPEVLAKMEYLDALIYEAIRLTPANLGGLKVTTETIELPDAGVQIPKNSNIFFCDPTDGQFDIRAAKGQKPELLGKRYPCPELHGFLPLRGLEIPLMVLQSKVFLIRCLQKYRPSIRKKRTFIRKVREKVATSMHHRSHSVDGVPEKLAIVRSKSTGDTPEPSFHINDSLDIEEGLPPEIPSSVSTAFAMKLFTKTPFPEPRRVALLTPRI